MRLIKFIKEQDGVPSAPGVTGDVGGGVAGGTGSTTTGNIEKYYPYNLRARRKNKKKLLRKNEEQILENSTVIAKEILNQIRTIDKFAMGAWGASELIATSDPPGLQFRVGGMTKFKGKVIITLNHKDLYDIEYGVIRNMEWISKHKDHDVYVEDLVKFIDDYVG